MMGGNKRRGEKDWKSREEEVITKSSGDSDD